MPSLKEVKGRIASVQSTQKITSAMKMVASAKLRKAQTRIERFLPYQQQLTGILDSFLSAETSFTTSLAEQREVNSVAIVAISSNSTLCGAFNSNVVRLLNSVLAQYKHLSPEQIYIYPIGKKIEDSLLRENIPTAGSYIELMEHPAFEGAKSLADQLIDDFQKKKIDRVELVYNHFKSTAVQVLTHEQFLPIDLQVNGEQTTTTAVDYIAEPDKKTILELLLPKSLRAKIYSIILDSAAAEQAARTVAMQIATDNASEILEDLTIQYNKQRQQAITNELLDIIGGAEALK